MTGRVSNDQTAEWRAYLDWLCNPRTCNIPDDFAGTFAAVLDELHAERARALHAEATVNACRDAMRDVRRIISDFGIVNLSPRLAALLEGTADD